MNNNEHIAEMLSRALPFLEHRMAESPQPELVKLVGDIHAFFVNFYDVK